MSIAAVSAGFIHKDDPPPVTRDGKRERMISKDPKFFDFHRIQMTCLLFESRPLHGGQNPSGPQERKGTLQEFVHLECCAGHDHVENGRGVLRQKLLEAAMRDRNVLQGQFPNDLLEEGAFLARGLEQGDLEIGAENLERNRRESRPRNRCREA